MPMRNKIKEFVDSRGMTAYQFIKETGIAAGTGYKLYKDPKHRPSPDVLEIICDTYEIQPNDILEWIKDEPFVPKQAKSQANEVNDKVSPEQQGSNVVKMPFTESRKAV